MKKILLILFMLCGVVFTLPAQNIRTLFVEAPDSVIPLLSRNLRADCIDFIDAGMVYPVENSLGGSSSLKKIGDDYLLLQSTGASTMEVKLLPLHDSFVICVVKTVYAEVADSRIAFFDSEWRRLDESRFFEFPSIGDFFVDDDSKLLDKCDIYLVSLKLNPTENTVVAEYTMPGYMNDGDASKVSPLLRKIVFRWNGEGFAMEQ